MKHFSLRARLVAGFALLTLVCWGAAAIQSWHQTRHNINELFDTQQMLFAKRLATMYPQEIHAEPRSLPETKKMAPRKHRGEQEDDALAFAIFTRDGRMVLNDGENGKDFPFSYARNGFTDGRLRDDDDLWRIVWLTTPDERFVVAVGQEWEYRRDMALEIVQTTLVPWLIALPAMLLLMLWLVTRALSPLKRIAAQLRRRAPDDAAPLQAPQDVPQEVRPLVEELNHLFSRISEMLTRERRFTSDAAHELRSPLAALKVQTEVAQMAGDDEAMRRHALDNLDAGITRAARLVDQLLTLSRLDAAAEPAEQQPVRLQDLLRQAVIDHYPKAQAEGVELILNIPDAAVVRPGQPALLAILARNLLDNAIRYGGRGCTVTVTLTANGFQVSDDGPGIDREILERIGERFFRPPGQEKSGSGLGLSIVGNIARLHGMRVSFANRPEGGFAAVVSW